MITLVEQRKQLKIFVSLKAKKVVEDFAEQFDMKEMGVASRIYNWFGTLPLPVQKWITGLTDGAILTGANLADADLTGAILADADLTGANLTRADLTRARNDLYAVLSTVPREAAGLLASLNAGKINGSCYEGECACLVGTIANLRHCNYESIPGLKPDSSRPIERLFLAIDPGHTPENHPVAKILAGWIGEWIDSAQSDALPNPLGQARAALAPSPATAESEKSP